VWNDLSSELNDSDINTPGMYIKKSAVKSSAIHLDTVSDTKRIECTF